MESKKGDGGIFGFRFRRKLPSSPFTSSWSSSNRFYHFPRYSLQGNLDSTLPTTVDLTSGFSNVNVNEASHWRSLNDATDKVRWAIISVSFDANRQQ